MRIPMGLVSDINPKATKKTRFSHTEKGVFQDRTS